MNGTNTLRTYLTAGTAAMVGASTIAVSPMEGRAITLDLALSPVSIPVALSAVGSPIEVAIKDTYLALEPWAAYAAELTQYVLGFIPGVWWLAPAIDLAYFTIEPLVQAGVFVVADVLGGNFAQIPIDINTGIQDSINNAFYFGLAWLESLVPLPPLPPFPPLPGAAVDRSELVRAGASRGTAVTPAEDGPSVDTVVAETVTAPVVEAPVVEAPVVEAPVVEAPVVEPPVAEMVTVPVVDAPVVEATEVSPTAGTADLDVPGSETVTAIADVPEDEALTEAPAAEVPTETVPVTESLSVEVPAVDAGPATSEASAAESAESARADKRGRSVSRVSR